ncbi:hypothetical protein CAPTEDRAFT_200644, partial [Capitella teleta]
MLCSTVDICGQSVSSAVYTQLATNQPLVLKSDGFYDVNSSNFVNVGHKIRNQRFEIPPDGKYTMFAALGGRLNATEMYPNQGNERNKLCVEDETLKVLEDEVRRSECHVDGCDDNTSKKKPKPRKRLNPKTCGAPRSTTRTSSYQYSELCVNLHTSSVFWAIQVILKQLVNCLLTKLLLFQRISKLRWHEMMSLFPCNPSRGASAHMQNFK